MLETKTLTREEEASAETCCEPDCGPDTCGCGPAAEAVEAPPTIQRQASAETCCEPGCGPDTCG